MDDKFDQPQEKRCMLVIKRLLTFEEGIADGSRIWSLARSGDSVSKGDLVVVSCFCSSILADTDLTCLKPITCYMPRC